MSTQAPPEDLLSQVPLDRLPDLPPNSVEPEVVLRRAMNTEKRLAKLHRDLATERAKSAQLQMDVDLLLRQSEVLETLDETHQGMYDTFSPKERYSGGPATAIFVNTDWHTEEKVDPSTINGLNEFNLEVAAKRIERCTERFLAILDASRSMSKIDHLVLAYLGDHITGQLHEDQSEDNYLSPTEALIFVRDQMHSQIDTIKKHAKVSQIDIYATPGNHGRTTKKPRAATYHKQSYEWLLYKWMERDYSDDPKIHWHVCNSYFNMANIQGKKVRFHHGDEITYRGGENGLAVPVVKSIRRWNESVTADLDIMGHWHQFIWQPRFVVSNCLIGYSAYAQRRVKAPYTEPSQTFIVIDRARAGAVDAKEVFCD